MVGGLVDMGLIPSISIAGDKHTRNVKRGRVGRSMRLQVKGAKG